MKLIPMAFIALIAILALPVAAEEYDPGPVGESVDDYLARKRAMRQDRKAAKQELEQQQMKENRQRIEESRKIYQDERRGIEHVRVLQ